MKNSANTSNYCQLTKEKTINTEINTQKSGLS